MFIMDYQSKIGKNFTYYAKIFTWNLLHAYIDTSIQIIIDEYPGDRVQAITRLQSQCENINLFYKRIYNILF